MPRVEVRDLQRREIDDAVVVLSRGMRDNPLNVAAHGEDPERRRRSLERMFRALFRIVDAQRPICGLREDKLVAVAGITPSGSCQPSAMQRLRFLPEAIAIGPAASRRVGSWLADWHRLDPDRPHSHLGPLAVDPDLQGLGIGGQLMSEYCRRLDRAGQVGYLETDKAKNVSFYERWGYEVIGEKEVIGVPNWFMLREARAALRRERRRAPATPASGR